jgi:hypothetical protein
MMLKVYIIMHEDVGDYCVHLEVLVRTFSCVWYTEYKGAFMLRCG